MFLPFWHVTCLVTIADLLAGVYISITFRRSMILKMKLFATTLVFVLAYAITLPVLASAPQTRSDCVKLYAGDDAAIRACIDRLNQ